MMAEPLQNPTAVSSLPLEVTIMVAWLYQEGDPKFEYPPPWTHLLAKWLIMCSAMSPLPGLGKKKGLGNQSLQESLLGQ